MLLGWIEIVTNPCIQISDTNKKGQSLEKNYFEVYIKKYIKKTNTFLFLFVRRTINFCSLDTQ